MSETRHEDRFIDVLQYLIGREVAQEISIPRKARRLDAAFRFGEADVPGLFGALLPAFADRVVLFEHESRLVDAESVASAWVGQAWVSWQRLKKQTRRRQSVYTLVAETIRPPLAVVMADRVTEDLTGAVPSLGPTEWPGLWATNDTGELRFNQGGLLVVDTGNLPAGDGFGFWRWLGRARDSDDANERLVDLLADNQLPINDRILFLEPIVERAFAVSDIERETASQRLRREGREEGRERGREEGREEGREKGREEGREQGREEGREQGRETGLEEGRELAKKEAILSGFRLGIPVQALSLMTGYSEEKVLWILRETGDAVDG